MSGYITDTLGWLAGAFYVLVALSIVYLYFFRIVPIVVGSIKEWNIFVVFRVTIVLASLAFLLGCVAVITGDWIFSQVLDTLPQTRMAREIDRVTGSVVRLASPQGSTASYPNIGTAQQGVVVADAPVAAGAVAVPTEAPVAFPLKSNALETWVATIQQRFNATGKLSDNTSVMMLRDIPQGVACDVAAIGNGWFPKQYEEWQIICSMDSFRTTHSLRINGTAARGLTGGGYYTGDSPYTVYGEGLWPEQAYDMTKPIQPTPVPTGTGSESQGSPSNQAAGAVAASGRTHTVQQGESLALIAQRYQVKVDNLVAANTQKYPRLKNNPNVIVVGWVLSIPDSQ